MWKLKNHEILINVWSFLARFFPKSWDVKLHEKGLKIISMYDISVGLPFYAIYLRGFNTFSWAYKNPSLGIISITSNKIKINNHNTLCRPSEKVVISSRTFHSLVTSHYKTNCYELCGRVVSVKLYEMANQ